MGEATCLTSASWPVALVIWLSTCMKVLACQNSTWPSALCAACLLVLMTALHNPCSFRQQRVGRTALFLHMSAGCLLGPALQERHMRSSLCI